MKLPRDVTGDQAVRALRRLGFVEVRQTGSHRILRKDKRSVVGEFRGGRAEGRRFVDIKTGKACRSVVISYAVNCSVTPRFDQILVRQRGPPSVILHGDLHSTDARLPAPLAVLIG